MIVNVCLIIIAICQVVRLIQNAIQLRMYTASRSDVKDFNNQFVESLQKDNAEWVHDLLKAYEKSHEEV